MKQALQPGAQSVEELRSYSARLKRYSDEELEDIYFNIHILRHPLRYRLLRMELERRGLGGLTRVRELRRGDLRSWIESRAWLASHASIRALILGALLYLLAAVVTL